MAYKISPTPSIEAEGGIAVHVNKFFRGKNLPHRFGDVVRLKNLKIGKRKISKQQAADELGISVNTLSKWYKHIDSEVEHAES